MLRFRFMRLRSERTVAEATAFLVAGTVAGAVVQFPIGWLSDQMDRRLVIFALSLTSSVVASAGGFGVFHSNEIILIILLAMTLLPIYGLCVAHGNDQLRPSQIVPASGTLVLVLNVGILFGAFGGAYLLGLTGANGFMFGLSGVAFLTAGIAVIRRAQADAPADTGAAQALSVQGSQMVSVLHPEAD